MSRQLKLEPAKPEVPLNSTLIVSREKVPAGLSEAEKLMLRANLDINLQNEVFFFHDKPGVRRALRMGRSPDA